MALFPGLRTRGVLARGYRYPALMGPSVCARCAGIAEKRVAGSTRHGDKRVERRVETRLNPVKPRQVVDFPDIEQSAGREQSDKPSMRALRARKRRRNVADRNVCGTAGWKACATARAARMDGKANQVCQSRAGRAMLRTHETTSFHPVGADRRRGGDGPIRLCQPCTFRAQVLRQIPRETF